VTSLRQLEANRRNALKSTEPKSELGKQHSRCNAARHGLTAETVIQFLEDEHDYKAFQLSVTADFDVRTAVERELVLRLAGLLWRLRRATVWRAVCYRSSQIRLARQGSAMARRSTDLGRILWRLSQS
jgi:glycerol-3-phosphate dehydrogenase